MSEIEPYHEDDYFDSEVEVNGWLLHPDTSMLYVFSPKQLAHIQFETADGFEDELISFPQFMALKALGFPIHVHFALCEEEQLDVYHDLKQHLVEECAYFLGNEV